MLVDAKELDSISSEVVSVPVDKVMEMLDTIVGDKSSVEICSD